MREQLTESSPTFEATPTLSLWLATSALTSCKKKQCLEILKTNLRQLPGCVEAVR